MLENTYSMLLVDDMQITSVDSLMSFQDVQMQLIYQYQTGYKPLPTHNLKLLNHNVVAIVYQTNRFNSELYHMYVFVENKNR